MCAHRVSDLVASFPVSPPQLFFAHSKIAYFTIYVHSKIVLLCVKKSWGLETRNEATILVGSVDCC